MSAADANRETGAAPTPEDLAKQNRMLTRRLARMEQNMRMAEELHDTNSKLLSTLIRELDQERAKSQALLLNVLPQDVIDRLGAGETLIADRHESVTVLFSDFVGFTELSASLAPDVVVSDLNRLFSEFDELCERFGVEKIKTIGDAYLAVGGLGARDGAGGDHVSAVVGLAVALIDATRRVAEETRRDWRMRIGIHTGPAVAGVIGTRKFVYDVWGDTVNMASRLESTSEPGRIHVSEEVASALGSTVAVEPRSETELKGKGRVATYYLRPEPGRRADSV